MLNSRVKTFLDDQHVAYEVVPHREAFTAQGVAASVHSSGWSMAKVLVVKDAKGHYLMAVVPASCKLDLGRLRQVTDRPTLMFATEDEIQQLFPDCQLGAMPPFGRLYEMPLFVDSCFSKAQEILFQAGNHREVVRMPYEAFERLAEPMVDDFCTH